MGPQEILKLLMYLSLIVKEQPIHDPVIFSFASYYGDHMVLQRAPAQATIWGYGNNTGDQVYLNLIDGSTVKKYSALVQNESSNLLWKIQLDPVTAGGPYNITITSNNQTLQLSDVLFGDVWLCSGQSNMQFAMSQLDNAQADIDDSVNYPMVRTFYNALRFSAEPLVDLDGVQQPWSRPIPGQISSFSAVCWLYGKELFKKLKIPIGLVETCWGGTRIEAWSSPEANAQCYPDGPPSQSDQNAASVLYNAMIHPFLPMSITGAIWYQGEANAGSPSTYACSLLSMVEDWRGRWFNNTGGQTDSKFPFGVVQLGPNDAPDTDEGFGTIRWAQSGLTGHLPNDVYQRFFMAVAMDLPDFQSPYYSIHPRFKRPAAQRLALAGLQVVYGQTDLGRFQGPLPTAYRRTTFNGLKAIELTIDDGQVELVVNSAPAVGFELCCSSTASYNCSSTEWALSYIMEAATGRIVIMDTCNRGQPYLTGVRYAWRVSPCMVRQQCPIYSFDNMLPMPPFVHNGGIN